MWLIILSILITIILIRLSYLIINNILNKNKRNNKLIKNKWNKKLKTLVCLGSGGHTSEMLQIIEILDKNKYEPIIYMLADTDETSLNKIKQLKLINNYYLIPRSRQVHQSYLTSVFSTIKSICYVLYLLIFKINQLNLIICNGPGTCVPIILCSFLLYKLMYLNNNCQLIYVESICRQQTLSITGRILLYFVDLFVVQSKYLYSKYPTTLYFGQLL